MSTGLRFKGRGANDLAADFFREGDRTSKRALRHMRRVAKAVMKDSIAGVPYETGELEGAHDIVEEYGDARRLRATVQVGGIVNGVDTDNYASWIHHGSWSNLGPGSRLKQAQVPAHIRVGKYFLANALDAHEDDFDDLLDDIMQGLIS